jgi:hypothetical protein
MIWNLFVVVMMLDLRPVNVPSESGTTSVHVHTNRTVDAVLDPLPEQAV